MAAKCPISGDVTNGVIQWDEFSQCYKIPRNAPVAKMNCLGITQPALEIMARDRPLQLWPLTCIIDPRGE